MADYHSRKYENLEQRLMANSVLDVETECWVWLGRRTHDGYPLINVREGSKHVTRRAHILAFTELTGREIPTGYELDHRCYLRCCINPMHVEPVTKSVNLQRRRYKTCAA